MCWSLVREWVVTTETAVVTVAIIAYLALFPELGRVPFVHGAVWLPLSLARGTVLGLGCKTFFPCALLVPAVAFVYGLAFAACIGVAIRGARVLVARPIRNS